MIKESSKQTILVVDDTPDNIMLLEQVLQEDYRVRAATSGQAALRAVSGDRPPDLILLDVMMPGMDGFEVCSRLKQQAATRAIPVIFVTSMGEVQDESRGFAVGAVDYITKPISPPLVKARVRTHLALYDQNRELDRLVRERTSELAQAHEELRVRERLTRFLAPELVDYVRAHPEMLDQRTESRNATVLFADICNFTTVTEQLSPEAVVTILNLFLEQATLGIMSEQGMLDKYIGDAVMGVFGVPIATKDHAVRALKAAMNIQGRMGCLNKSLGESNLPPLSIGIGLHTGMLVAGAIGSSRRLDYTVIGDTVNVAARIEKLTRHYSTSILLSDSTRNAIGDTFSLSEVEAVSVKGRAKPVGLWCPAA